MKRYNIVDDKCLTCHKSCQRIDIPGQKAFCSLICRFLSHVKMTDNCWVWQGAKDDKGYGRMYIKNKGIRAHRISWELYNGTIPEGKEICHSCDNPPCVNPEHLWLGSHQENIIDALGKGRLSYCTVTTEVVPQIRQSFAEGLNQREIARKFKVGYDCVRKIVKHKTWKNI